MSAGTDITMHERRRLRAGRSHPHGRCPGLSRQNIDDYLIYQSGRDRMNCCSQNCPLRAAALMDKIDPAFCRMLCGYDIMSVSRKNEQARSAGGEWRS